MAWILSILILLVGSFAQAKLNFSCKSGNTEVQYRQIHLADYLKTKFVTYVKFNDEEVYSSLIGRRDNLETLTFSHYDSKVFVELYSGGASIEFEGSKIHLKCK